MPQAKSRSSYGHESGLFRTGKQRCRSPPTQRIRRIVIGSYITFFIRFVRKGGKKRKEHTDTRYIVNPLKPRPKKNLKKHQTDDEKRRKAKDRKWVSHALTLPSLTTPSTSRGFRASRGDLSNLSARCYEAARTNKLRLWNIRVKCSEKTYRKDRFLSPSHHLPR